MTEQGKDPLTGLDVRVTDNGLKDCDVEGPQVQRVLTASEIAEQIEKAGEQNGNC